MRDATAILSEARQRWNATKQAPGLLLRTDVMELLQLLPPNATLQDKEFAFKTWLAPEPYITEEMIKKFLTDLPSY